MNWIELINEIVDCDKSMSWIASQLDVSPATIRALRDGRNLQPQYPTGAALIALHKRVMRRKYPKIDTAA